MVRATLAKGFMATAFGLASLTPFAASKLSLNHRQENNETSPYVNSVSDYVDSIEDDLWEINKNIHDNPELGYKEFKAHKLLTDFMAKQEGWNVTRSVGGIETAFMAVFEGSGDGPVVSFNAEYDALEGLGHACGHNLIATTSLGGALAAAEIMRQEKLAGKVILFGTPAEESLGGKVKMLEAGIFENAKIDISLISHPGNGQDSPYMITMSTDRVDVEYEGREAHAAASPWQGVNAQDALLLANSALSYARQQFRTTDRVHGIIESGGSRINVIPALSSGSYQIRAADEEQLEVLTDKVQQCFKAGAVGTGAKLNFTMRPYGYANMKNSDGLAASYSRWFEELGGEVPDADIDKTRDPGGSTDQGNISHEFPSISPQFEIYFANGSVPETGPHTEAFEIAAGSKPAFEKSLMVAKSLAGVAVDVLTVDGFLDDIKAEFKKSLSSKRRRQSN
ncbi:hypothetical protein EDB81DRAFT_843543 [Dactylonectria macrodidyma]|uniref:Peptidase M20 domain-containing protein 2 n=1 Tax=Dactylonectria macrodidyma TaxID=307937 RepID=A0A9P9ER39_9HYPO|nr:hypothetical protein EDB81DRAFT_843543 [Dactylonectria macrodidyma]